MHSHEVHEYIIGVALVYDLSFSRLSAIMCKYPTQFTQYIYGLSLEPNDLSAVLKNKKTQLKTSLVYMWLFNLMCHISWMIEYCVLVRVDSWIIIRFLWNFVKTKNVTRLYDVFYPFLKDRGLATTIQFLKSSIQRAHALIWPGPI